MRRSEASKDGGLASVTTDTPSIFISYRRDDSAGHAGRLADRLAQRVGADRVFRDIEDIAAGEDFVARLERQVDQCQVLLALIGPRWLLPGSGGRPRLFDPHDWVRREIARALDRGLRVIPVLLQGASMPAAEALPPDLARLARLNATELRESQFDRDLEYLVGVLTPGSPRARLRRWSIAAALIALAAGGAYGGYLNWDHSPARAKQRLSQWGVGFDDASFIAQAAAGHAAEVGLFLRAGQALEAGDVDGHTALEWAVENGHAPVVRLLVEAGASPDKALPLAALRGSDEAFDLLMARTPGKRALNAALAAAAAWGALARMDRLRAAGAEIDADDRAALRSAAFNGQVAALRWLIDHGARIDGVIGADGETILHIASGASIPSDATGDPITQAVELLLEHGADPNAVRGPGNGQLSTPLLTAAYYGRLPLAEVLLARGARPDLRSSEGSASTPLMVAAEADHAAMATLLLERGADINAQDSAGETPLMMATRRRADDTVELLIRRGADVNARDQHGLTALMFAVDNLDEKTAARLLQARAEVDAATPDGWTALMRLASRNIMPDSTPAKRAAVVARLLIAHGADPDRRNALGQDARALATDFEAPPEMVAVLSAR